LFIGVYSRGNNRGGLRGARGRGRPPISTSTKIGSPTESAQILLSLSGNSQPTQQFFTTSKNVKIDPSVIQNNISATDNKAKISNFEPRRRGRRRGAINSAYREKLLRDVDTQIAIESLKRDLSDDGEQLTSPLLSSLLSKPEAKANKAEETVNSSKYLQTLKDFGLPTNVPILLDNGEGKLVTLTEDVLKSVMDSDGNLQFHVTEGDTSGSGHGGDGEEDDISQDKTDDDADIKPTLVGSTVREMILNKQKKPRQFIVKEMQATRSDEDEYLQFQLQKENSLKLNERLDSDSNAEDDLINEAVLESLKHGAASEAELDPEAVVLFEVTGDKKVEKYVVSAREVNALKALNEQLTKQKKQLADMTKNNVSTIGVVGTNTKVAELKLKIGKTKSILSQVMECAQQGLREKLKNYANQLEESDEKSKPHSEVVQLEFIDGNGEKIEGYQVEGTVIDKRISESKENLSKDSDLLGLFDMEDATPSDNPLIGENELKKCDNKPQDLLSSGSCVELENNENTKDMGYQLVMNNHLEDQNENIPYDQIEAMISETDGDIVIEHKREDFKYVIGNGENMMNHDENYVVYDDSEKQDITTSEYVIYGNTDTVLPGIPDSENTDNFVVGDDTEVIHNEEGTEYIVYGEDKSDLSNEMKEIDGSDVSTQYIVYTSDDNTEKSQERYEMYKEDVEKVIDEFVIYSGDKESVLVEDVTSVNSEETEEKKKTSPTKDVPFAVGLVPLKDALEKFQSLPDHQPRRTRSNSSSGNPEPITGKRRLSNNLDNDRNIKREKVDNILQEQINSESL
jgi:hypothetical protein